MAYYLWLPWDPEWWVRLCKPHKLPFLENHLNGQRRFKAMGSYSWTRTSFYLNTSRQIGRPATKGHAGCVSCNFKECYSHSLSCKRQPLVLCCTQHAQLYLAALQIGILYLNTMNTTFIANCSHLFWNFIPSMKVKLFLCLIKFLLFKLNSLPGWYRLKNNTKRLVWLCRGSIFIKHKWIIKSPSYIWRQ